MPLPLIWSAKGIIVVVPPNAAEMEPVSKSSAKTELSSVGWSK